MWIFNLRSSNKEKEVSFQFCCSMSLFMKAKVPGTHGMRMWYLSLPEVRHPDPSRQNLREPKGVRLRVSTCCPSGSAGSWTSCGGRSSSTCRRWPWSTDSDLCKRKNWINFNFNLKRKLSLNLKTLFDFGSKTKRNNNNKMITLNSGFKVFFNWTSTICSWFYYRWSN